MKIKKWVIKKVMAVFLAFLLLVSSFSPYLLIAPAFSQVKAQEVVEVISPAPTAEPTLTPAETPIPTPTIEVTPTSEPTVTPEPTPTPTPTPSQWTFEKVELNKEYIAPQNSEVKLTFTKLPDPSGNIKIEEITLTQEQVEQTGSLSDKAYDITSDMKDGDFTYNLSLPIPESSKGKSVEVKFAEELSNIASAEKVDNTLTKTDTSVSVTDLNHFTIFVVSGVTPPSCTGASITPPDGTTACYLTIQSAITAASSGNTINIAAGTYTENLTVNKSLTLLGVGDTTIINGAIVSAGDDATIQDLKIVTPGAVNWDNDYYGVRATANNTLTLDNVTIDVSSGYPANDFYGIRMRDDEPSTGAVININNSRIKGYAAIYLRGLHSDGTTIIQTGTVVNVSNSTLTGKTSHSGPSDDFAVIAIDDTTGATINFTGASSVISEYTGDATSKERLIRFLNTSGTSITGTPTYTNGTGSTVNANALFISYGSDTNTVNGKVIARWITNATEFEATLASSTTTPIVVGRYEAPITTTENNTLKTGVTLIIEDHAQVTIDSGDTFTNNGVIVIETGATFTNNGTINGSGTISGTVSGSGIMLCVNTGGTSGCFSSIQSAIAAASSGNTINIAAGTYTENLTINKSLTLLGVGNTTIINGNINVTGDSVTIQDLKITNSNSHDNGVIDYGVKGQAGKSLTLESVTIGVLHNGVYMTGDSASATALTINHSSIKGYSAVYLNGVINSAGTESAVVTIHDTSLTGTTSYSGLYDDFAALSIDYAQNVSVVFTGASILANEYTGGAQATERLIWFYDTNNVAVTGTPTYSNTGTSEINDGALFLSGGYGTGYSDTNTVEGKTVAMYVYDTATFETALALGAAIPIVVGRYEEAIVTNAGTLTLNAGATLIIESPDYTPVTISDGTTLVNNGEIIIESGATLTNNGTLQSAVITGSFKYGQLLTAELTGLTNAGTPTFQWKRGATDIGTGSTYTLLEEDIGSTINVVATTTGIAGTGIITSAETETIAKTDGPVAPSAPTLSSKTDTSITLTAAALNQFSIDGYTWQDSNVFSGLIASTRYTFVARAKETTTTNASVASSGTAITTYASNNAPTFDAIANQNVNENASQQTVQITGISGPESQSVSLSATSDNTTRIPNPSISGSGSTQTLSYTPVTNQYGSVTITVTANDGQPINNTFSRTFTITIIQDTTPPNIGLVNVSAGTYSSAQSVTITAADDAVATYYTLDGTTPDNTDTLSAGAISVDAVNGVTVILKYISYDTAGNGNAVMSVAYVFDKVAPTGTILINDGAAYTNAIDHEVTLTLSAGADLSGVTEMAFSNGSTYSTWEAYSISKLWNVSAGDGSKTVRVKFRDAAGNETAIGIPATITVDTVKPVITLNGVTSNIEVGGTYEELGATANDGSTVSTTGSVNTAVVATYVVTYNATDTAGNSATPVTRTVNVVDTTKPVISLVGSNTVTLEIHNTYTDAGVAASDNYDGNLTNSVVTNATNINKNVVGSYTVTYNVVDANSNHAIQVTRTVNVVDSIDEAFNGISNDLSTAGIASNMSNVTTDNIQNFTGLYFEKSVTAGEITTKMGRLTFTAELDLSSEATQEFLQDLGTYMEANQGSMKFDATTQDGMKAAGAEIKMYGINALGYYNVASIIVRDDEGNILSEGDEDYPDLTEISYASTDGGTLIFTTEHFTQFELDQNQTTPDGSGNATLSGDTTEVVLTDPNLDVIVDIASGTVDPTIDVSAFITDDGTETTGTLPEITINSDVADVVIPNNTEVTGPAGWDGIIQAPISGTPSGGNAPAGFSVGSTVISVGSPDGTLTFEPAVTIVLPGVTGTVGYRPSGSDTWYTIITCGGSYDTPTLPTAPGECAINNGTDTKIVTYHFTSFGSLTANQSSSGGVGTTTASAPVCNDTKPGSAPTLLSAIAGFNSVTLTWSKAVDPVSYYLMTFGTSAGSQTYGNPNVGNKDTTSYTVNGLSGGATYYFRVRAGNGCAPGDFSNELSAAPTGGFIEGIPVGFEAGVLGEATKSEEPTEESTPGAQGTALGAETKNGVINSWWWPWILLSLLPLGWVVYHYKKPRP